MVLKRNFSRREDERVLVGANRKEAAQSRSNMREREREREREKVVDVCSCASSARLLTTTTSLGEQKGSRGLTNVKEFSSASSFFKSLEKRVKRESSSSSF